MLNLDDVRESAKEEQKATIRYGLGLLLFNLIPIGIMFNILKLGDETYFFFDLLFLVISLVFSYRFFKQRKVKYDLKVKKVVFDDVYLKLFPGAEYDTGKGINYYELSYAGVLSGADIDRGNDYLAGVYEGVSFQRSDIITKERNVDKKGNENLITLFKGQVYGFDFNKQNNLLLRITDRGLVDKAKFFASPGIKLDNAEFSRKFIVECEQEHEAFYVLTPHFMERYLKLNKELDGKTILGIENGKIYISVHSKRDSFEPNLLFIGDKFKRTVEQDIMIIKTIIDELDLKNTLFRG